MDNPDVVLLGAEWRSRVALRAQLIEEGYDVQAADTWPDARLLLRGAAKPRLAIVDLQALEEPRRALDDLKALMPPERVLVLAALGTISSRDLRDSGFHVASRPIDIGSIVAAVRSLLNGQS